MDVIKRVTPKFNKEFERWINRTKKINGFPTYTELSGYHRVVRKKLMGELTKFIQAAPPIKIDKKLKTKPRIKNAGKRPEVFI